MYDVTCNRKPLLEKYANGLLGSSYLQQGAIYYLILVWSCKMRKSECVCVYEIESERVRERERKRKRDREREREREKERERERERESIFKTNLVNTMQQT